MKIVKEALAVYFTREFTFSQADLLAQVISDSYVDLVKTDDFNELKAIVGRLAVAQEGTEQRMAQLETQVAELTTAVRATTDAVQALTRGMEQTRTRAPRGTRSRSTSVKSWLTKIDRRNWKWTMAELVIELRETTC